MFKYIQPLCLVKDFIQFYFTFWYFIDLTRYVLDNKNVIEDRHVLDIGSGCGSLSIAAAKLGVAASITANDIDPGK